MAIPVDADRRGGPSGSGPTRSGRPSAVRREAAWLAAFAALGLIMGLGPLGDNSFLTHLTTGRAIVDDLAVPHSDPYTFTSFGEPWVVQSWLANTVYGVIDHLAGGIGLRLFTGAVTAGLAALIWRLSHRAESLLPRLALSGVAVVMGITVWSERPLLLGLALLALTMAMVDSGRPDARWAVPLFFVWANVHGSFPLGLVALGTLVVASRLDGTRSARATRLLAWGSLGAVLGGVFNPFGFDLLLFPIDLLSKREQLRHVAEWQPPDLSSTYTQLFVFLVALSLAAVVRSRRWSALVPISVFAAAAAMGARNVAVASIVLIAVAAPLLRGLGSLTTEGRSARAGLGILAAASVAVIVGALLLSGENYRLDSYPVAAVDRLAATGALYGGSRWVHTDRTGNYLTWRFGGDVPIFIDDRMELHPPELIDDYLVLNRGEDGWQAVLDRWAIDAMLWPADRPLAELVRDDPTWAVIPVDETEPADNNVPYVVACRRGAAVCDSIYSAVSSGPGRD